MVAYPLDRNVALVDSSGSYVTVVSEGLENRIAVETVPAPYSRDAFGRFRASNPQTLFNTRQIFDQQHLLLVSGTTGSATITYVSSSASSVLQTSTTSGDKATIQSRQYHNYQPGKSQLVMMTCNFSGSGTNVVKRIGYFDDQNGIFLHQSGSSIGFVIRSDVGGPVVDTFVSQSQWNIDKFDGTGISGIQLDTTKVQLLAIDFEWLGGGNVRGGFIINNHLRIVHEFRHANVLSNIYMRTPNLPIRWQIENVGAATGNRALSAICGTVISEGGQDHIGIQRSADRGSTALSTANVLRPLISMRLKQSHLRATVKPTQVSIATSTNANFLWRIIRSPVITGGAAASWQTVQDSAVEFDISRNGVVSDGHVFASGYAPATLNLAVQDILGLFSVASDMDGNRDEIIVAVQSLGAQTEEFFGSISWFEV